MPIFPDCCSYESATSGARCPRPGKTFLRRATTLGGTRRGRRAPQKSFARPTWTSAETGCVRMSKQFKLCLFGNFYSQMLFCKLLVDRLAELVIYSTRRRLRTVEIPSIKCHTVLTEYHLNHMCIQLEQLDSTCIIWSNFGAPDRKEDEKGEKDLTVTPWHP